MTKSISVAVELLDQLAGMELDTTERSIKIQDELRAILAHPAEAEGVELTGEYHADCNRLIAALSAVTAERDRLRELLRQSMPIMKAHAGASHMLEGFSPKRNQWDDIADRIDAALAAKEA